MDTDTEVSGEMGKYMQR